jgi:hypothetical protein
MTIELYLKACRMSRDIFRYTDRYFRREFLLPSGARRCVFFDTERMGRPAVFASLFSGRSEGGPVPHRDVCAEIARPLSCNVLFILNFHRKIPLPGTPPKKSDRSRIRFWYVDCRTYISLKVVSLYRRRRLCYSFAHPDGLSVAAREKRGLTSPAGGVMALYDLLFCSEGGGVPSRGSCTAAFGNAGAVSLPAADRR